MSGPERISTATRVPEVDTRTPGASVGDVPSTFRENSSRAPVVFGRDDRGEVATANVAEKPLGSRIDPPDDSRRVEDVARDADAAQSLLDIAADCQASGHH